ncbi:MAG: ClbS/DfsB family four-helix bundle protein [Trueperaceae bacterium]
MPRPTSKRDLLAAIEHERAKLDAALDVVAPERMLEPGVVGEWSVKDVLAHLYEWEQMALGWYRAGLIGEVPELPAPGYTWRATPQLNRAIFEKHRDRPLDEVMVAFHASRREILGVIESLSDEDLFTSGRFAWTRKNALGAYFVSATSSHYLWARTRIARWAKRSAGS